VVQNLVGNAVRYCDHKVRLVVVFVQMVMLMSVLKMMGLVFQKKSETYFEAFARLDDSRTRASGGYGLGLSIVSRIAYWFGGILVDQSPNLGGARFTMTWPAKRFNQKQKKNLSKQKKSTLGAFFFLI
jgi:two-component system sensor histidine kinase RstB